MQTQEQTYLLLDQVSSEASATTQTTCYHPMSHLILLTVKRRNPSAKLLVQIEFGNIRHKDELHIYPNVEGTLVSWKTYIVWHSASYCHLIHNPSKFKKSHHLKYPNRIAQRA